MCSPDLADYQLTSILAECSGGLAVVYSGLHKPDGQKVALKRYFVDKTREDANLIQQEIQTTKELQHRNILPYLTSFVHGHELYVVSPLMQLGSCRDILDQFFTEGMPELACAIVLREVLQALQYLHKQHYIHRSVSSRHVLVGGGGAVRLAGLRGAGSRLARGRRRSRLHALPPPPSHGNTNLIWLSPELLEQNLKGYDERSDIYSLGILCCELANGAVPFSDVSSTLMLTEKVRGSRPQLLDCTTFPDTCLQEEESISMYKCESGVGDGGVAPARRVYSSRRLSEHFHHLSDLCLQRDPEKRPSATQLLQHSFFKQIRKTDYLPSVIARATPIKDQPDTILSLHLEEKLSEMEIEKTEWDF